MNRQISRRKTLLSAARMLFLPIGGRALAQEAAPPSSEPPPLTGGLYPELDAAAADAQAALKQRRVAEDEYRKNPSPENKQKRDAGRAESDRKAALARFRVGQFVLLTTQGERRKLSWAGDHVETLVQAPAGFWGAVQIRPNGEVIRDGQIIGRLDRDSADPPPPGLLRPPRPGLKPQPTTPEEESPAESPAQPEVKTKPKPFAPGFREPKGGGKDQGRNDNPEIANLKEKIKELEMLAKERRQMADRARRRGDVMADEWEKLAESTEKELEEARRRLADLTSKRSGVPPSASPPKAVPAPTPFPEPVVPVTPPENGSPPPPPGGTRPEPPPHAGAPAGSPGQARGEWARNGKTVPVSWSVLLHPTTTTTLSAPRCSRFLLCGWGSLAGNVLSITIGPPLSRAPSRPRKSSGSDFSVPGAMGPFLSLTRRQA